MSLYKLQSTCKHSASFDFHDYPCYRWKKTRLNMLRDCPELYSKLVIELGFRPGSFPAIV